MVMNSFLYFLFESGSLELIGCYGRYVLIHQILYSPSYNKTDSGPKGKKGKTIPKVCVISYTYKLLPPFRIDGVQ